jgi:hypothetical protein
VQERKEVEIIFRILSARPRRQTHRERERQRWKREKEAGIACMQNRQKQDTNPP